MYKRTWTLESREGAETEGACLFIFCTWKSSEVVETERERIIVINKNMTQE